MWRSPLSKPCAGKAGIIDEAGLISADDAGAGADSGDVATADQE